MSKNLNSLFKPKSVAVVGVSDTPTKLATNIYFNMLNYKYEGKVYPVNPKYDELYNRKVYKKVSDIPGKVDLVVIVVPVPFVAGVLEDAGKAGAKNAIIITAGFKEVGHEGIEAEEELKVIAEKYNINIVGPNCLGIIVPGARVNASFADTTPSEGNIAFFAQSGAFCTAMLDLSKEKQVGFSHFVSFGNKVDVSENDLINHWLKDEEVKVIGGYIEEIKSGHELIDIYRKSRTEKPLILIKPGSSEQAQAAISSHTGSLAGSMQTYRTAMEQNGIVNAERVNQLFNYMMSFSWAPIPNGNRVAIVTNAGGPGIIATDAIVDHGLKIAEISESAKEEMRNNLPATASVNNPVDVIGDAVAERYRIPVDILSRDENVDAILVILTPQSATQIEETSKFIVNAAKTSEKPIYAVFLGGKYILPGMQRLYDGQVPAFRYIHDAVEAIEAMYKFGEFKKGNKKPKSAKLSNKLNKGKYFDELDKLVSEEVVALSEDLSEKLAAEVGIDLPKQIVSGDIEQIKSFCKNLYPVVMKATTDVIAHKTDKKALYLGIASEEELTKSFDELTQMIKDEFKVTSPVVLIQEMVKADEELFIGANRDGGMDCYEKEAPGFGHLLAFGKGGIYTEVYKDIKYALALTDRETIHTELSKTKVYEILNGARGLEKLAIDKSVDAILAVQDLLIKYPMIASIDINPLFVTKDRAVCVDMKIFLQK